VPRRKKNAHLYELAKRGAEVQLRELVQETKYLIDLFPHLRDAFDKDELPLSFILAKGADRLTKTSAGRVRRRRRMSAAARKAVSQRMKKYWAGRRSKAVGRPRRSLHQEAVGQHKENTWQTSNESVWKRRIRR
jgi:hypothetical protein